MSIAFNGTTSRLLRDGGSLGLAYPVSMFVWLRPNSSTVNQFAAGLGNTGGSEELMVYAEGAGSGRVRAFHMTAAANSTTPISTAWTPALAVFTSQSSRTIYYGAGAAVTETTSVTVPLSVINRVGLGNRVRNDSLWFAGDLAKFAIWSGGTALGQTEFDALAGGAVPSTVSPGTLWDYWELVTDAATQTGANGRVLTAFSTSQGSTHPPVGMGFGTGATLARTTAAGTLSAVASAFAAGATLARTTAGGSLAPAPGVLTSEPLTTNNGTILANVALDYVDVYLEASGVFVGRFTGLTTNGAGVFSITSALLTPGTAYKLDWRATGGQRRMPVATAA